MEKPRRMGTRAQMSAMYAGAALPPEMLRMFSPRAPPPFMPPPFRRKRPKRAEGDPDGFTVAKFVDELHERNALPVELTEFEERATAKKRKKETLTAVRKKLKEEYNPKENPDAVSDPLKTLFVGNLSYDTSESKLKREMSRFGLVKSVRVVLHKMTGQPMGYAFVEFESEKDLKNAYKHTDGLKVDGRRIITDVERGRTVTGWLPSHLGGGKGKRRPRLRKQLKLSKREKKERKREKEMRNRYMMSPPSGYGRPPPGRGFGGPPPPRGYGDRPMYGGGSYRGGYGGCGGGGRSYGGGDRDRDRSRGYGSRGRDGRY